jgi:hypothetical protein
MLLQAKGTLTETNLRSLLEDAQTERATGTLTVRNGGDSACTLYFLFGHLFHAISGEASGDEAVLRALNWPGGEFDFDAKAKLPADETVKSSVPELVERAASGVNGSTPETVASEPEPAPESEPAPEPERASEPEARSEPKREERPRDRQEEDDDSHEHKGVKHRPQPKHGREPIPVPAGQVIYDSLKTSFVDFPRLITTLERESYTGYVRLLTENASGLIFFKEGTALECVYDVGDDPAVDLGKKALQAFSDEVTHGHGVLDVVGLSSNLVDGLYELTVAQPVYTELYASWVDMTALLKFLEQRKLSGSLMVRSASGTGVIILTEGKLTGAYTSDSREIAESAEGVLALCSDPEAMIEVKAAAVAKHEPLDVDDVVGSRRAGRAAAEPPRPGPAPAPAVEAQAIWEAAPTPGPAPAAGPPHEPQATQSLPSVPTPPTPLPSLGPEDMPSAPSLPAIGEPAAGGMDWEIVITDLQNMTEEALGNRARKVKDVLGGAERSQAGVEAAIDQIPTISILFVDSSRLEALAADLRTKLQGYLQ